MLILFAEFAWPAPAASHPLPRTVADVIAQIERPVSDGEAHTRARALLDAPLPAGADASVQIEHYGARAAAAALLGRTPVVLEARRRLVELTEGKRNHSKHLIDLAITQMTSGEWAEAERNARRAATAPRAWWGQDIAAVALLARMQSWLGDVRNARTATDRIEEWFRAAARYPEATPFIELVGALIAWAQADTQLADGQALLAERALRAASQRALADTRIAEGRARSVVQAPAPDSTWQLLDLIEAQLARLHLRQSRPAEAEQVARGMLARNLQRSGRNSPSTAVALATFGEVLAGRGRWQEAAELAELAADALAASGVSTASAYAFQAERVRIDALVGLAAWGPAVERIDGLRKRLAGEPVMLAATQRQGAWEIALVRRGRAAEAAPALERLYAEQRRALGEDRYETAETLGLFGMAHAALGRDAEALVAFARAVPVLIAPARGAEADTEDALRALKRRAVLEAYLGLLHGLQGSDLAKARGLDAAAEGLRISDALRGAGVQSALAASAARALAGSAGLGDLIRREQDGKRQLALLNDRLLELAIAPASEQRNQAVAELRARLGRLESEREQLFASIQRQFPDYANLISPTPAGLPEARKALRPGEALISIVNTEERSYVWALGADGQLGFHASSMGAAEVAELVARLRNTLDPPEVTIDTLARFDAPAAHALYAALLKPLEPIWGGARDLAVVTGGALGRLPLAVLLTEPVTAARGAVPFEEMKAWPWLARRVSVTDLPSINAYVRLRALPAGNPARNAFAGYGDPRFDPARAPGLAAATRALKLRSVASSQIAPGTLGVRREVSYADYARLAPLPDTREEVEAIARALGADPAKDVFLGEAASRRNVRSTDLSTRRIVVFATHGLLAGELPGLTQPALALSASTDPSESPLLTLEDVLGLKLDADWVVLSACNTAAGEGQGAEAVSGLGRGFFFAGSRALLATHWPVETVSARLLVSELFARYTRDPTLTRAQALRQTMLAMIEGAGHVGASGRTEFSYAHPMFWAAYALYGDGGR